MPGNSWVPLLPSWAFLPGECALMGKTWGREGQGEAAEENAGACEEKVSWGGQKRCGVVLETPRAQNLPSNLDLLPS